MIRRAFALCLVFALALAGAPSASAAAGIKQNLGNVQGSIVDDGQKGVPNVCVQLRNVDTGQVVAKSTTDKDGKYEFRDVVAGNYVVESVNCSTGAVLAVSSTLAVAGAAVSGIVLVLGSAAVAGLASGAGFFSGTVVAVLLAGVGAGVVAVVAARNEASPK